MQSADLFEEAYLLPNTEIFHQESQFNSVKLFFLSIAETVLLFQKNQILFHFPHNKQDEKEGQRQGRGLTLTIWEAFTSVIGLEPDKKGYLRLTVKVLEVTTDESKLQIPCNCDVKFSVTM